MGLPNLWVTQIAIILMNTFGYGLNGPCREMLYTKTSKEMKYKAKSWSDMVGNSLMKSLASLVNDHLNTTPAGSDDLNVPVTAGITTVWVGVWMVIVQLVGKKHASLMETGETIK